MSKLYGAVVFCLRFIYFTREMDSTVKANSICIKEEFVWSYDRLIVLINFMHSFRMETN